MRQKILEMHWKQYEEKYPYRYGMKKAEVQVTYLEEDEAEWYLTTMLNMLEAGGCT